MTARKATIVKELRARYRLHGFNGVGQCTLLRFGRAAVGEPRTVMVQAPEFIAYILLRADT